MKRLIRALQYRLLLFVVGGTPPPDSDHSDDDDSTRVRGNADFSGSLTNALRGIVLTAITQRNFRIELGAALVVLGLGLWLRIDPRDGAILALTVGTVLAFEAKNTSVELSVDLSTREFNWYAKHAKDSSSGAVLIAAIASVVVGALVLGPPLLHRLAAAPN